MAQMLCGFYSGVTLNCLQLLMQLLTDAVILNESRTELSPVREHYGGPRQLKLRLKLRSSDLELAPDLIKDVKRHLITKCAHS